MATSDADDPQNRSAVWQMCRASAMIRLESLEKARANVA
jgi:hypothetical protein